MLVSEDLQQAVAEKLRAAAAEYTVGDPADEATRIGPVASESRRKRVDGYIRRGIADGTTLVVGGPGKPEGFATGAYVKPTIFSDVDPGSVIAQEEIFGPVLVVIPYADEDHAVEIANGTIYGLSGAVTGDEEHAMEIARRLRVGQVDVNGGEHNFQAPSGGYKQSGNGVAEHARSGPARVRACRACRAQVAVDPASSTATRARMVLTGTCRTGNPQPGRVAHPAVVLDDDRVRPTRRPSRGRLVDRRATVQDRQLPSGRITSREEDQPWRTERGWRPFYGRAVRPSNRRTSGFPADAAGVPAGCAARRSRRCATCRSTTTADSSSREGPTPGNRCSPRHALPRRVWRGDHINPGMMRVLDRLEDTPAQVMNHLGETLKQTRMAEALRGDETAYTGLARSAHYRWFTDPASRLVHPESDHAELSRLMVADLHGTYARDGGDSRAGELVDTLREKSPEFARLWHERPVPAPYCASKRFRHPQVGALELHCQTLVDPDRSQRLLVYTAVPGTESHTGLRLLSVLGRSLPG
ncbi:NAD/NADP-dependent betaine aldehyde dehydrogenase [Streptomyces sp. RB17]|nr:NAD/NADP-dependent betaine aldehyde dehydrogenase [Streptomyces sp. RB17]